MTTPNIIFIVVDTLRADYLGCYGCPGVLTPNVDALSRGGATFNSAYSTSNFTAPAFASLFTTLYPVSHGVYDFRIKRLPPSPLMEILKREGYTRHAVVDFGFFKSYLGESFDAMESLTDLTSNWSTEGPVYEIRRAIEWIGGHLGEPFFLFLHISPPHTPYRFPKQSYEMMMRDESLVRRLGDLRAHEILGSLFPTPVGDRIEEKDIERFNWCAPKINEISIDDEHVAIIKDLYRMEVEVVDEMIGLLMDGLKSLGSNENTMVSFLSDHGEELWDHGSFSHGTSAMYNEVIRTPWIVSYPKGILPGRRVDANVSHTNVMPTLVDLAGIELGAEIRSRSVRRFLDTDDDDEGAARAGVQPVYCETGHRISVIRERHKLIAPNKRTQFRNTKDRLRYAASRVRRRIGLGEGQRKELYDLRTDPGERNDLASKERDTVSRLAALIDAYYEGKQVSFGEGTTLTAEEEERIKKELEGLGYY